MVIYGKWCPLKQRLPLVPDVCSDVSNPGQIWMISAPWVGLCSCSWSTSLMVNTFMDDSIRNTVHRFTEEHNRPVSLVVGSESSFLQVQLHQQTNFCCVDVLVPQRTEPQRFWKGPSAVWVCSVNDGVIYEGVHPEGPDSGPEAQIRENEARTRLLRIWTNVSDESQTLL